MDDPLIARVERTTVRILLAMALIGALARPGDWRLPAGVLGGGALMWLAYRGVRGGLAAATGDAATGHSSPPAARRARLAALVKFFTRHAIVALAGYAMMVRLHLDPVGMLAGVSSPGLAAAAEAVRSVRAARHHGRKSSQSRPL